MDDVESPMLIGDRLRAERHERGMTLAEVAERTGVSISTLSRLESGLRKATVELLIPMAQLYGVTLDDLAGLPAPAGAQPAAKPLKNGAVVIPLTREPGGLRAYKMVIPFRDGAAPDPRSHAGWEWMYVLSGRLRVVLAEHDLVLRAGEAAEFDTHVPHWFGAAGPGPAEVLTLFGPQGERMHVRARSRGQWG